MVDVLEGRPAPFAVNAPPISAETARILAPFSHLAQTLGSVATQIAEGQVRGVEITYSGELAEHDTASLKASVIRGLLEPISEENITLVNAALVARSRGLRITELKRSAPESYSNLITVRVETSRGSSLVGGTTINNEPTIVQIDDYRVHIVPSGAQVLLTHHTDQPGMIGRVGTILGEADVNVGSMQVGREQPRGPALMLLTVDEPIPSDVLTRLRQVPGLENARVVRI
jgi:D-3-phosphoglycerate dehydrogenase